MTGNIASEGLSADDTLTVYDEPPFDPNLLNDTSEEIPEVWINSDILRKLLYNPRSLTTDERETLRTALTNQLSTVTIYIDIEDLLNRLKEISVPKEHAQIILYVLLFPGEAKDNTGIKDLNDKVIGPSLNTEFIHRRWNRILEIFRKEEGVPPEPKFAVATQTYKTAYIVTYEKKRRDFAEKLAELDDKLRTDLLDILKLAEKKLESDNSKEAKEKKKEIKNLRKKLNKKGYRFDIYFGLKEMKPIYKTTLENVYVLVTEALKACSLARYVAKVNSLNKLALKFVKQNGMITPDNHKDDARGKSFEWLIYMKASNMAEENQSAFR